MTNEEADSPRVPAETQRVPSCPPPAKVRSFRTVRVSITARCDLDCLYCSAAEETPAEPELSAERIALLAEAATAAGARTVRLTGGEPLLRDDIEEIVSRVRGVVAVRDLALTTNAQRLAGHARSLREMGLDRVNIGLPSLRPETYRRMTGGELAPALEGLDAALASGLAPVKLNVVVIRGENDDEIADFVGLARREPVHVRFIEMMPFAGSDGLVPADEIRKAIAVSAGVSTLGEPLLSSTAELYRPQPSTGPGLSEPLKAGEFAGRVGIISPVTEPFCERCDRLRITSEGRLRACLSEPDETDLRAMIRAGVGAEELAEAFRAAFRAKPSRHSASFSGSMRGVGG